MKLPIGYKAKSRKRDPKEIGLSANLLSKCHKTGKTIWNNKKQAKIQAKAFQRTRGGRMSAYLCISCDGWHIGHEKYRRLVVKRINQANKV